MAVKAIVEKPTFKICFFVKYFRQRLLSLVNKGLHAAIIRLSLLIHEGEQRFKPYIVGDPRMLILSSLCDPPFEKSWLRPCGEAYLGHERLGSGNSAQRTMGREKERSPPLFLHPRVPRELIIIIILFVVFILLWSTGNLCGGENIARGKCFIMRCHLGNRITL